MLNNVKIITKKGIAYFVKKEPKVFLHIYSMSGSNTHALYKNQPNSKNFSIVSPSRMKKANLKQKILQNIELMKSSVVITDYTFIPKYKNTIHIQTWHGFPLKAMGLMDKNMSYKLKMQFVKNWNKIDYILSYSKMYSTLMNACFGQTEKKYVITGMPRNDFLLKTEDNKICERFFKQNTKVIFYLPTFRKTRFQSEHGKFYGNLFNIPNFDLNKFIEFLILNNFILVYKKHIADVHKINIEKSNEECYQVLKVINDTWLTNNHIDLYELLVCADLLITDYSSVYFDFLLTGKPIIFIPTDIEEYRKKRGFLLEPYDMWTPGPKVFTQKELQNEILKSLSDPSYYAEERERIRNIVHYYQDANSSKRVWEFINSLLEGQEGNIE